MEKNEWIKQTNKKKNTSVPVFNVTVDQWMSITFSQNWFRQYVPPARANMKVLFLWAHPWHSITLTLLRGKALKTKELHLLTSPPICCPAIYPRAQQTPSPVFTSTCTRLFGVQSQETRKMGKILYGIFAVLASVVLGKTLFNNNTNSYD